MSTFAISGTTTYVNDFGATVAPALTANVSYTTCVSGSQNVPTGTTAATSYGVPFGSITTLRALRLANNTTQELSIKYNGVTASYGIPAGGQEIKAFTTDAETPIVSIDLVTTASPSVGAGTIDSAVFGR